VNKQKEKSKNNKISNDMGSVPDPITVNYVALVIKQSYRAQWANKHHVE